MKTDYKKLLKPYEKESIESLKNWIQIDSVYDETTASKDKPFGEGVAKALEFIAKMGENMGFEVDRCDGYCTEISFGKGDLIAIYAHADVVPVSGKWDHEPFGAEIVDDVMYGRGTSDDKGPAMAALYSMLALKEKNLLKDFRVSLVVGGNEESGSRCLEHYFEVLKKPYPKYGFTPDGDFPLIYGEKGIGGYSHTLDIEDEGLLSFEGGVAANSVIDEATARINSVSGLKDKAKAFFNLHNIKYIIEDNSKEATIKVFGKSAHGSMPELGVNAGLYLLKFLGQLLGNLKMDKLADYYLEPTGKKMGAYYETKLLHNTTYNVGIISFKEGKLTLIVNFRYPEGISKEEVRTKINDLNVGYVERIVGSEPLLIDPESAMIKSLVKVYQEETGDKKSEIITIGGGTYARESKNTIAFGSHFPGREDNIHSPNEKIHLEDYLKSQAIYAHAIIELGKIK